MVSGNTYIVVCSQAKTAFLKIAGGKRVDTTIALPHWLTTEYQEENYAVPKQADVLAEQDFAEKKLIFWERSSFKPRHFTLSTTERTFLVEQELNIGMQIMMMVMEARYPAG